MAKNKKELIAQATELIENSELSAEEKSEKISEITSMSKKEIENFVDSFDDSNEDESEESEEDESEDESNDDTDDDTETFTGLESLPNIEKESSDFDDILEGKQEIKKPQEKQAEIILACTRCQFITRSKADKCPTCGYPLAQWKR